MFFLATVFACCAGLPGCADAPDEEPPLAVTAAASPGGSRLICRRYFGCLPAMRSTTHPIED
jgi:hypothetical protein